MWNRAVLQLLSGLSPFIGTACQWDCPPPDGKFLLINTGAYRSAAPESGGMKRAVLDRQSGTATFTFERDGKQVVEVWRITASKLR